MNGRSRRAGAFVSLLALCSLCLGCPPANEAPNQAPPPAPQVEREPAPQAPAYELRWTAEVGAHRSALFAPWGDVVSVGLIDLQVLDAGSGELRGKARFKGGPLGKDAVGFVDSATLVYVDAKALRTLSFPFRRRGEILEFEERARFAAIAGARAAVAWRSGEVKLYGLPGGEVLGSFRSPKPPTSLCVTAAGRVALGTKAGVVLWEPGQPEPLPCPALSGEAELVALSADGARLFVKQRNRSASVIDLSAGSSLGRLTCERFVGSACFLPEGWLALSESNAYALYHPKLGGPRPLPLETRATFDLGRVSAFGAEGAALLLSDPRARSVSLLVHDLGWEPPPPPFDL